MLNKISSFSQKSLTTLKTAALGAAALTLSAANLSANSTSLKLQNELERDTVELSAKQDTLPQKSSRPGVPHILPGESITPPPENNPPEPLRDIPPDSVRFARPGVPHILPGESITPLPEKNPPVPLRGAPPKM